VKNYGAVAEAALGRSVVEFHLFEFQFASGTSRYNSTPDDFDWNGVTWFSGRDLFGVEYGAESMTLEAHRARITLSAMNPARLAQALIEPVKGRRASVRHVVLDASTRAVIGVQVIWAGRMGTLEIEVGGGRA
jgi:hypothetical protein